MRIGMGVPALGFIGGIELHAWDLARSLRTRGHEVVLLHGAARGREIEAYSAAFWDVRARTERRAGSDLDVAYIHKAQGPEELEGLGPVAVAVHDHDLTCLRRHRYTPLDRTPCHRAPGLGCVAHGCVVVRDRGPEASAPIVLRSPFAMRRQVAELARRAPLVACSAYVAGGLVAAGADPARVHVVHPVPPRDETPLVARPDRSRLLVVGQLVRGKGFDLAIDALRFLPREVTLTIAGDGSDRAFLEERAREVAPGRVSFLGFVPPSGVTALYDAASVVLVPSRWPEPFGMVGIEAMRRGRPVVAAAHGGIPEWLTNGNGGVLVEPANAEALAQGAHAMLRDAGAGDRARADVQRRFSHDATVVRVERLLRGLSEGARALQVRNGTRSRGHVGCLEHSEG